MQFNSINQIESPVNPILQIACLVAAAPPPPSHPSLRCLSLSCQLSNWIQAHYAQWRRTEASAERTNTHMNTSRTSSSTISATASSPLCISIWHHNWWCPGPKTVPDKGTDRRLSLPLFLCIKRLPINMMYDAGPEHSPCQPLATEIAT